MGSQITLLSVLGLIIGLALTFFGERIFKFSLTVTGFAIGGLLGFSVAFSMSNEPMVIVIATIVVGAIFVYIVHIAYKMGFIHRWVCDSCNQCRLCVDVDEYYPR